MKCILLSPECVCLSVCPCHAGAQANGAESGGRGVEDPGFTLRRLICEPQSKRLQARVGFPSGQLGHPRQEVSSCV